MHGYKVTNQATQAEEIHQGYMLLLNELDNRYGRLSQEKMITYMVAFFQFRARQGEDPDELITRFEIVREHARIYGNLEMSFVGYSFVLLNALGVPIRS